jgi:hypothetical protein
MSAITAILTVALIVIILAAGFGVLIALGVLADWSNQKGSNE